MARLKLYKRNRLVFVKSSYKDLETLSNWVIENKLKPNLDKVYMFEQAPEAHKHIETKRTCGKIVLIN